MMMPRQILTLVFLALIFPIAAMSQMEDWQLDAPGGELTYDPGTGDFALTKGKVQYGGAVLFAESASGNTQTGEVSADGKVRIFRDDMVWVGEHIDYNFKTRQLKSEQFRTGKPPVFAAGEGLHGDLSNRVYTATNGYITTDDISEPALRIRASSIKIVPGESVEARNAVLYAGKVPLFYFPYYSRKLKERANRFTFIPGYSSRYGGFLLGTYEYFLNDAYDGAVHLDYRTKRGVGAGADANLHLNRWGEAELKYYFAHDLDPNQSSSGLSIPTDRQWLYLGYNATPFTNLNVKSRVSYESDVEMLHDFFENEYRQDSQPTTFAEVNKLWPNVSLDVYAQPRVNDFRETVERLPEIKLTAFSQQLGPLPLYYDSESSAGWYRRLFSNTNNPHIPSYSAYRADTFHQLILPWTFFGWLNVEPRVGGRFTYYDYVTATNAPQKSESRGVFNTGMEISFKASRVWPAVKSKLFDVNGIRHIIQPAVNYVFVPTPNRQPDELPQFDYQQFSYRLLPIDFPDYNSIDSIDSQSTLRLGLRNKLQTKREGHIENLLWWDVYTDWRLQPNQGQACFSDLFSDLAIKPRSWITFESLVRWDMVDNQLNMAFDNLSFQPNDVWNWSIGHWYLRDGFVDPGSSLISGIFLWRLNENWAFRTAHFFEANDGRMQEQDYTIYRDLRSWTAALTLRMRDNVGGPNDIAVAFTFSLKAAPSFSLGSDTVRVNPLLGD